LKHMNAKLKKFTAHPLYKICLLKHSQTNPLAILTHTHPSNKNFDHVGRAYSVQSSSQARHFPRYPLKSQLEPLPTLPNHCTSYISHTKKKRSLGQKNDVYTFLIIHSSLFNANATTQALFQTQHSSPLPKPLYQHADPKHIHIYLCLSILPISTPHAPQSRSPPSHP
jgi:hypothetical protein